MIFRISENLTVQNLQNMACAQHSLDCLTAGLSTEVLFWKEWSGKTQKETSWPTCSRKMANNRKTMVIKTVPKLINWFTDLKKKTYVVIRITVDHFTTKTTGYNSGAQCLTLPMAFTSQYKHVNMLIHRGMDAVDKILIKLSK